MVAGTGNMHAVMTLLILFALSAPSAPACDLSSTGKTVGKTAIANRGETIVTLTKRDDGKEVTVHRGDTVRIELQGLGGTGYMWYFDNLQAEHLELISEETKAIDGETPGAPVLSIWRLKAKNRGTADVKMALYRIWEGIGSSLERFSIRLHIQ